MIVAISMFQGVPGFLELYVSMLEIFVQRVLLGIGTVIIFVGVLILILAALLSTFGLSRYIRPGDLPEFKTAMEAAAKMEPLSTWLKQLQEDDPEIRVDDVENILTLFRGVDLDDSNWEEAYQMIERKEQLMEQRKLLQVELDEVMEEMIAPPSGDGGKLDTLHPRSMDELERRQMNIRKEIRDIKSELYGE